MSKQRPRDPADEPARAMEIAVRLLSHRARSESEIRARLTRAELSPEIVDGTIERLRELSLLDDAAFAREKAASVLRRGGGPRLARARLGASGVDEADVDRAVEASIEEAGGEEAAARAALERRYGDLSEAEPDRRRKAAAWLVRRGFRPAVAGKVTGVFSDSVD